MAGGTDRAVAKLQALVRIPSVSDRDASHVDISLSENGRLEFAVWDDGNGFSVPSVNGNGAGLTNLRDRLTAIGGELSIESRPGQGTRVTGTVPVQRSGP